MADEDSTRCPASRRWPVIRGVATLAMLCLALLPPAGGQPMEPAGEPTDAASDGGPAMKTDEARRTLAEQDDPAASRDAQLARLERQLRAAYALGDRGAVIRGLESIAQVHGSGPQWARTMLSLQFNLYNFGNGQRAFEIAERLLAADGVPADVRAQTASALAFEYANSGEREKGGRVLAIAERAHSALGPDVSGTALMRRSLLAAQSEVARLYGDLDASTALAREGYLVAQRGADRALADSGGNRKSGAYLTALGEVGSGGGLYSYALVRQGRLVEARAVCEAGLARTRAEDTRPDMAAAWSMRLSNVLLAERRFDDALKAARSALAVLEQGGAQASGMRVGTPKEHELMALIGLQRWAEADQAYNAHLQSIQGDGPAVQRFADPRLQALLAAKNGRADAAAEMIERTYRYRVRLYGPKHPQSLEAQGVRGVVRLMQGSISAALSDYEALFGAILDNPSGWTELEPVGRRGAYLSIAIDDYLRYVAGLSRESDGLRDRRLIDRASQVLDWMAIGASQSAINDSTSRLLAGSAELAQALRELQDARNLSRDRYRDLNVGLLIDPKKLTDDERKEHTARLKRDREAAQAARDSLEKLNASMTERFPGYADLIQPRILRPDAIARLLARDEVLVSIVPTRFAVFVTAINASGERQLRASAWTEAELDRRVAALRRTLDIGTLPAGRAPPFDLKIAHELYQELLAPLAAMLPADGSLIIAAQGSLASLPVAALVTAPSTELKSAPWLVRRVAVTQLPSTSSLAALRRVENARRNGPPSMIGFGDPRFAAGTDGGTQVRRLPVGDSASRASTFSVEQGFRYAAMPPLPDTRDELKAIADAMGADAGRDLVLGPDATRLAVLQAPLAARHVVAFATHGLLPGEIPGLSKPALAMAATDDAGGPLLILDDILTLKMHAEWVVLSACNTAGGEHGGAAMSGLVRGFFFAGSRSVLATHWAVDSVAARQLVAAIFTDYAGSAKGRNQPASRAQSLRTAQLAMIDGQLGDAAHAHPFFWAPYALFGDPIR